MTGRLAVTSSWANARNHRAPSRGSGIAARQDPVDYHSDAKAGGADDRGPDDFQRSHGRSLPVCCPSRSVAITADRECDLSHTCACSERVFFRYLGAGTRRGVPRQYGRIFPAVGRGRGPAGIIGGSASHQAPVGETGDLPSLGPGGRKSASERWGRDWGCVRNSSFCRTGREPKHLDRSLGGTAIDLTRCLQRCHGDMVHRVCEFAVKIKFRLAKNVSSRGLAA